MGNGTQSQLCNCCSQTGQTGLEFHSLTLTDKTRLVISEKLNVQSKLGVIPHTGRMQLQEFDELKKKLQTSSSFCLEYCHECWNSWYEETAKAPLLFPTNVRYLFIQHIFTSVNNLLHHVSIWQDLLWETTVGLVILLVLELWSVGVVCTAVV